MCSINIDLSNLPLIFSIFKSFERFWICRFFRSGFNMQVFQIWKTSGTTYLLVVWKSSGLLGSLLTKSSGLPGSRLDFSERFGKFLCLIFLHLVISSCIKFLLFSQTKTLQTHFNLFDLKTPNFI